MSKFVEIFTDGGCRPNPGKGSYAFVIVEGKEVKFEKSFAVPEATNNQMELKAVIEAIKFMRTQFGGTPPSIYLTSDSQYVCNGITHWIKSWKAKNFNKVANAELWIELLNEQKKYPRPITFQWVRGHNKNQYNERADQLCSSHFK